MSPQRNKIKLIATACALLFVVSGVCPGVTARKPIIKPARSWKVIEDGVFLIQEGDELRIECQGEGKLQFSTEKLTGNIQQSEFQTSKSPFSNSYTFIRPHTIKEDTGWYGCADESVEMENDDQTTEHPEEDISWIYVYVNSSKPFAAVEEFDFPLIQVIAGGKAVVPCRPTSPELPVEFYKNTLLEPVGGNITYDPKIGFIINYVEGGDDRQPVECKIAGNDAANPYYDLRVNVADRLSDNDVKTDELRRVTTGNNLTLHCNITFMTGIDVNMNWKTPNSIAEKRKFNISTPPSSKNNLRETRRKLLTIVNADKRDAGDYTCVVGAWHGTVRSSTRVEVFGPEEHFINLTVDGDTAIEESEHGTAKWKMTIDTHPNAKLDWYKDGAPIANVGSDNSSKYSDTSAGTIHLLQISRLNITDNGNYTIRVTTSRESKDIALRLTVKVKPMIVIHKRSLIFKPGEIADFSCNATGSPIPNVTWSFSGWSPEGNGEDNSLANFTKELEHSGAFSVISQLNMPISSMGNLTCESCNTAGCTYATEPIFVSDGDGFFGIVRQGPEPVVEGDDIALVCAASLYNYTNHIRWMFNNSTDPGSIDERIDVENATTNFTWQSILRIPGVKKSDAGSYSCKAETQAGKFDESKIHVMDVLDASKPSFNFTDMDNSDVRIDLVKHPKTSMNFTCRAQGMPRPEVTWQKDGNPLINNNGQYELAYNNSMLLIHVFTLGDGGNYSCTAVNRLGSVHRYVYIKIDASSSQKSSNPTIWISFICVLIVIIIIVITYMGIKVHRERVLRKELLDAGLTHFEEGALECLNPDLTVDDQAELLPYDKKWEFPRELLKIGKQLGSGAFGVVMKAEARGICVEEEVTTVAVKMVRRSADPSYMKALSSELKIMIHLGQHLNVVNLLGACTKTILTKRELYVIVEYCRYGNLHNYLQRHRASFIDQIDSSTQKINANIGKELLDCRRESVSSQNRFGNGSFSFSRSISKSFDSNNGSNSGNELLDYRQGMCYGDVSMSPEGGVLSNNSVQPGWRSNYRGDYKDHNLKPICTQDLLCWAWQVSLGMEYLTSRKVLHGDLAARNILLADDNIVKICDFGLAKNMYKDDNYKKKGEGPLPIKWMAIESIRDRIFSTQSDIWSFGIVLWEFFTLARTPYPGMEAERQYDRLVEGYRMEKPEYATDEIYEFMLNCWKGNPSLRPTFPELAEKLGTLLNENLKMHYLELNTPYMDMNTVAKQNGHNDYLTMMSAPNHDQCPPDQAMEEPLESGYLAMSPVSKTSEPGIFSPRVEDAESHFKFPPPSKKTPTNSDTEDNCVESVPMLTATDQPYVKSIDVHQRRAAFINQSRKQTSVGGDSGYCNFTSNPRFPDLNNAHPEVVTDLDEDPRVENLQKNNHELTPPISSGNDNYVNMPKQKTDQIKDLANGVSNPSYVMMTKPEEVRPVV